MFVESVISVSDTLNKIILGKHVDLKFKKNEQMFKLKTILNF